jgi:hypothetical protein
MASGKTSKNSSALKQAPKTPTNKAAKPSAFNPAAFKENTFYTPYRASKDGPLLLGYKHKLVPIADSVDVQTVIMTDDSMRPIFCKGDVLTIDNEAEYEPGYYMLIRVGHLLLVRRYIVRGDVMCYWPESSTEHEIVDDGMVDPRGVVTAVQRVDGTTETLDLDKLAFAEDEWPLPAPTAIA